MGLPSRTLRILHQCVNGVILTSARHRAATCANWEQREWSEGTQHLVDVEEWAGDGELELCDARYIQSY